MIALKLMVSSLFRPHRVSLLWIKLRTRIVMKRMLKSLRKKKLINQELIQSSISTISSIIVETLILRSIEGTAR